MAEFNKQQYDNKYAKENYDRCIFNVPKGQKTIIEAHWKARGYKSLNAYINDLINRDMGLLSNDTPQEQKSEPE